MYKVYSKQKELNRFLSQTNIKSLNYKDDNFYIYFIRYHNENLSD